MFQNLPHEALLKQALSKGADFSELFCEHSSKTNIVCEDKKIDKLVAGIDQGVGLRLFYGTETTFGCTNNLEMASLQELASSVAAAGSGTARTIDLRLKNLTPQIQFQISKNPQLIPLKQKLALVQDAEKLAWSKHPSIVQVRIGYVDLARHVEISNSLGEYTVCPATLTVLSITITTSKNGELFKGYHSMGGHIGFELYDPTKVEDAVDQAVKRAVINMNAARSQGGLMPVVISSEAGGTMVHEAVGHGLEADLAGDGMSVYQDKMGETVATSLITVVEDPTIPGRRGSFLFDDEGIPSQRVALIEKGVLKHYMHSRLTAKKMGTVSNGHGRRESYAFTPVVRMANTMITPGTDDPQSIIASVDKGLFVKMMGGGQVNTVNGDFVFEVTEGYRIENGKIGEPVRGATLTGNGPEVLKIIDKVGNDLGFSLGTCGKDGQCAPVADAMPTVRIPEMVVGGTTG